MASSSVLTSLIAALAAAQLPDPVLASAPASDTAARRPGGGGAVDSVRTVRTARRAQEQFEALRRVNLPFQPGGPRGPCDLQVGRLCYWHDDGSAPPDVPEPDRIVRGRERLLESLADAARVLRGDEWIVGQRVRYLIEARRHADAIAATTDCRSAPWWCSALSGLAFHRSGQPAHADSAFARALATMPAEQRCRWTDISMFLEGDPAKHYRRLPCADRTPFERHFWWLAQPLHHLPGNDLRAEFLARRTMSRLEQQARSAYNLSWGSDVEELLMRYGWPTWWTRDHPSAMSAMPSAIIVGHEPTPSFYFHPAPRLLKADVGDARADDWEPRRRLPLARYAPAYAASFSELRTQIAVFRRGDSAAVVATYESPRDSLFSDAVTAAALVVGRDDSSMTVVRHTARAGDSDALIAKTAWGPMLVSVEVIAPRTRGVARARFGVRPSEARRNVASGRLGLSDILLYRPTDTTAASLDEIARHALGSARTAAGGRVGIYWEIYGLRPAGEPLAVTLSVERAGAGWRARAAERLRLASKVTPLRVRWQEVPKRDGGFATRAISVDLSSLPAGRYRMQLSVVAEDGSTAVSERVLELAETR